MAVKIGSFESTFSPLLYNKLAFCIDGNYLSREDDEFVYCIWADLLFFSKYLSKPYPLKASGVESTDFASQPFNRVLLFPPLHKRCRFLLHKSVEEFFPQLFSFSICENEQRRTVICPEYVITRLVQSNECLIPSVVQSAISRYNIPITSQLKQSNTKDLSIYPVSLNDQPLSTSVMNSLPDDGKGSKSKRPDRQLYVPRARRSSATDNKETVQKGNDDEDLLKRKLSFTEAVLEDAPEKTLLDDSLDRESNHKETANSDSFTKEKVELINSPENIKEDDLDQSTWDKIFDENGDSLDDSQVINELTLAVGQVEIQKPTHDYLEFRPHDPDLSKKDFSHVLEVYDFPSEYKTADLLVSLSAFKERSFDIKWVDDTHALAVFSSSDAADEALKIKYHFIKVRPLSDAIPESKWKAKRALDDLQPYKPRPPTCAQVARRLVSGALGLRVVIPKEQKELEKLKLKEAKENRRKALRQRHDVWEGTS